MKHSMKPFDRAFDQIFVRAHDRRSFRLHNTSLPRWQVVIHNVLYAVLQRHVATCDATCSNMRSIMCCNMRCNLLGDYGVEAVAIIRLVVGHPHVHVVRKEVLARRDHLSNIRRPLLPRNTCATPTRTGHKHRMNVFHIRSIEP